uniref:Uncharacterized protein n=1 Tax=Salix viminalis TaxID=40686 RepID=A0A6N2N7G6_SALVM
MVASEMVACGGRSRLRKLTRPSPELFLGCLAWREVAGGDEGGYGWLNGLYCRGRHPLAAHGMQRGVAASALPNSCNGVPGTVQVTEKCRQACKLANDGKLLGLHHSPYLEKGFILKSSPTSKGDKLEMLKLALTHTPRSSTTPVMGKNLGRGRNLTSADSFEKKREKRWEVVWSELDHRQGKNIPQVEQGRHIHEMSKEPDTRGPTFARNHVDAF